MRLKILDKSIKNLISFVQFETFFWMNDIIKKILISITLTLIFINNSHAIPIGPFKRLFQEAAEFFSKSSDEVIKKGNKADEMMSGSASKNIDDITIATKDQELIINKIGDDVHSSHYEGSINQPAENISINHGVKLGKYGKKGFETSDKLYDLYEFVFDHGEEEIRISEYILKSWIGRIYRVSNYFSRPNRDDRMLLVCKNSVEIFYFTIVLNNENDINRAYLTDHQYFQSSIETLQKQELLILMDDENVKVMATKPSSKDSFPFHYFTIYPDQYFVHNKYSDPQLILKKATEKGLNKYIDNKCYKANKSGIEIN